MKAQALNKLPRMNTDKHGWNELQKPVASGCAVFLQIRVHPCPSVVEQILV